jgi:hypothetical protein
MSSAGSGYDHEGRIFWMPERFSLIVAAAGRGRPALRPSQAFIGCVPLAEF